MRALSSSRFNSNMAYCVCMFVCVSRVAYSVCVVCTTIYILYNFLSQQIIYIAHLQQLISLFHCVAHICVCVDVCKWVDVYRCVAVNCIFFLFIIYAYIYFSHSNANTTTANYNTTKYFTIFSQKHKYWNTVWWQYIRTHASTTYVHSFVRCRRQHRRHRCHRSAVKQKKNAVCTFGKREQFFHLPHCY